ncbi:MAG TPA: DUF1653 domain-containing protein [Desulfuromonadales bacterium]|nr:DUF1653 domain-containing protein [Desulfuromonadales bacterium]
MRQLPHVYHDAENGDRTRHEGTDSRRQGSRRSLVSSRKLYGDHSLWVRPFGMFLENVVVEGYEVPRFEWSGE